MARTNATAATTSDNQQRASVVQEYDRLISQFGEDPFRPADGRTKRIEGVAMPKQRHELLAEVTEKSLRCADLIEKALAAADQFKLVDAKIANAHRQYESAAARDDDDGDAGSDEDIVASDATDDGSAAQLLRDLIAANEELDQARRDLSQADAIVKPAQAGRHQLWSSEHLLQAPSLADGRQRAAIAEEFRSLYLEEFTSAFGDELDQFRQEDRFESKDVAYLISSIQSGADAFFPLQKKLFVESAQSG